MGHDPNKGRKGEGKKGKRAVKKGVRSRKTVARRPARKKSAPKKTVKKSAPKKTARKRR